MQQYHSTLVSSISPATKRKTTTCVIMLLAFALCPDVTISNWVLSTAVLSGSALKLLKLQEDAGTAAAVEAGTDDPVVNSRPRRPLPLRNRGRYSKSCLVNDGAFWKDTALQEEIQAIGDCHGKEEFLSILYAAGIITTTAAAGQKKKKNKRNHHAQQQPAHVNVTATPREQYKTWLSELCPKLASWSDVTEMYGSQPPVVIGMETCARYRQSLLLCMQNNNNNTRLPLTFTHNSSSSSSIVEPRLLVRFEDLLFHAEEVFSKILECGCYSRVMDGDGDTKRASLHQSFKYTVEKTKAQNDHVDFMGALLKYGCNDDHPDDDGGGGSSRIKGMTRQDLLYAATGRIEGGDESSTLFDTSSSSSIPPRGLDPKLMEMFRYRHPPARLDVEKH